MKGTFYRLFAVDTAPKEAPEEEEPKKGKKGKKRRRGRKGKVKHKWTKRIDVLTRAMVLAGDTLFVAGPPDVFIGKKLPGSPPDESRGLLWAVSTKDGEKIKACDLSSGPVFDGMAAAYGGLYISLKNGNVVCIR
jgi:hypothetical protein